jgi:signal transduction histidine kinase
MQIVFTFTIWALLGTLLGLLLCLVLVAWLGFRAGQRPNTLWHNALQSLPLGVALFRTGNQPHYTNPTATELLPQLEATTISQMLQTVTPGVRQSLVVRGAKGLVVQLQALRLAEAKASVLLTLRDISQQQQAEASYRKLIHTLSHEVLTPLTALQGHLAHIAATSNGSNDTWSGSLQISRAEVERLTRLTSNLLILSRLEAGQPLQRRPTNVAALAEETVLQLIEKADTHQITLHLNAPARLPRLLIDRDAWKQVLLNLIDNGIKYGNPGGRVTLTLTNEHPLLVMTVSDDGPGIAPDDLPHLFTELFRSERHRHVAGSGLGLAIVRQIVTRHDGTLNCTSQLGHGTTFRVTLPLTSEPPVSEPTPQSNTVSV